LKKTKGTVGFWTEHSIKSGANAFPASSEVSALGVGTALTPCLDEPSIFVLRGVYSTYSEARAAHDAMGKPDWNTWLARWKEGVR